MSRRPAPLPWFYRWRTDLSDAAVAVITVFCGTLSLLISLVDKRGNVQHRIARVWRGPACGLQGPSSRCWRETSDATGGVLHRTTLHTSIRLSYLPQFRCNFASWEEGPLAYTVQ